MKRLVWLIQTAAFYLFTLMLAAIPTTYTRATGRLVGVLMSHLLAGRRRIAMDNIRQALPFMKHHPAWSSSLETPEEIARETFIHLGTSLVEVCQLYHGKDDVTGTIEVRGREHLDRARAKHKGLIFVGGHCGNWELLALASYKIFKENLSAIARRQNNPYLNTLVDKMRMRYNNKVIYNKGALRPILGVLKKDGIIGMLSDQAVFPEDGALIELFGRKAWANKAPVMIAQKTGVPLVPVFMYREGDHHVVTIHPEYELCGDSSDEGIRRDIQALSRYLEEFVIAHPADWYWVHRRWKRAGEMVE